MSPWLTLSLAVLFVSFGAILVRLAAAPPLAVSFYRVAIASLILLPFAHRDARRSWPALDGRHRLLLLAAGLALALHFATWIASLSYTSVASSVLLVNTAPVFAIVLSRLFLHEKPPLVVQVAIPIAFAGAALIAFGDWTGSPGSLLGNGLALAGAVTFAVYQVVGRGLRDALPLNAYVLGVWSVAACVLALLARSSGVVLGGYPVADLAPLHRSRHRPDHRRPRPRQQVPALVPRPDGGPLPPRRAGPRLDPRLARLPRGAGAVDAGRWRDRARGPRPGPREARVSDRRTVHVLFTGGTISMRRDPLTGAALPALSGREIVARVPGLRREAHLRLEDLARLPGPHVTPAWMWRLRRTRRERPRRPARRRCRRSPTAPTPSRRRPTSSTSRSRARSPSCCAGRCARSPTPAGTGRRT